MRAKKAAASKAAPRSTGLDNFEGLEDALPDVKQEEENVDLGRWSVKETIERARSTGEYSFIGSTRTQGMWGCIHDSRVYAISDARISVLSFTMYVFDPLIVNVG